MTLQARFIKKVLHFSFDARTSRGRMKDKTSWIVKVWDTSSPSEFGLGECGPLPGLSTDDKPEYEGVLKESLTKISQHRSDLKAISAYVPPGFSSIRFGIETALLDLANGGNRVIYDNSFIKGTPIPSNGLVWMGDTDLMLQQASINISKGYRCIKIKVGGLNFDKECDILHYIRSKYFRENITIRLDANGAFKSNEALYKLNELARFNIHSIEQPVKPGEVEMEEICRKSPIPIALDEEIIGIESSDEKQKILKAIKPQFIILKPTLHGGLVSCAEWIDLAEQTEVGWWITSALESNIGLNAICQFAANYKIKIPQGLGTGQLYEDNFESPLTTANGEIYFDEKQSWNLDSLMETQN